MVKFNFEQSKLAANILVLCALLMMLSMKLIVNAGDQIDNHETLITLGHPNQVKYATFILVVLAFTACLFSMNLRILLSGGGGMPILTINILVCTLIGFLYLNSFIVMPDGLDEGSLEENCALVN